LPTLSVFNNSIIPYLDIERLAISYPYAMPMC
jgi:hypothetical protein